MITSREFENIFNFYDYDSLRSSLGHLNRISLNLEMDECRYVRTLVNLQGSSQYIFAYV